ncbi:MAG: hypothetical protein DHS80DRAFT_24768 [Piptocephalis tieghemiana]|nr:MAG: hypothetical protein DHS80DRAFT_24768 [Piptocephalis tieghemiana]
MPSLSSSSSSSSSEDDLDEEDTTSVSTFSSSSSSFPPSSPSSTDLARAFDPTLRKNRPVIPGLGGIHRVSASDTLSGLSIQYGIPKEDISRVNRLYDPSLLWLRTSLIIPPTDPEAVAKEEEELGIIRRRLLRSFHRRTGHLCSDQEASRYLRASEGHLDQAVHAYEQDEQSDWTRKNPSMAAHRRILADRDDTIAPEQYPPSILSSSRGGNEDHDDEDDDEDDDDEDDDDSNQADNLAASQGSWNWFKFFYNSPHPQ